MISISIPAFPHAGMMMLVVDLLYGIIDPRIRLAKGDD